MTGTLSDSETKATQIWPSKKEISSKDIKRTYKMAKTQVKTHYEVRQYSPHFTDEETEAQEGEVLCLGSYSYKWQNQTQDQVNLTLELQVFLLCQDAVCPDSGKD